MNITRKNKVIVLLLMSTVFIFVIYYLQYITVKVKYVDFILISNLSNIEEQQPFEDLDEIALPLTWKETDQKLFNLNFEYIIKSRICEEPSADIIAVLIVTSYFADVELRSAMRRSFTSTELLEDFKFVRVFLLGLAPGKETYVTQKQVENEAERFGDIIQGNFQEAYRNLTYKHVMGLLWASDNCPNVKYIMKMDDDIVVNIYRLQKNILDQYLSAQLQLKNNRFLAGFVLNKGPVRNSSSKWFVTKEEYKSDKYPPYLSGWFYITTPMTAKRLVHSGRKMNYFWIDDVFITGIVAKRLHIKPFRLNYFFAMNHLELNCCMEDTVKNNNSCRYIFGPNGGENNLFYDFNLAMKKCSLQDNACIVSTKNSNCDEKYKAKNFQRIDNNVGADGIIEKYQLL